MYPQGRIRESRESSASDWVAARIASHKAWTVGSIVPTGFEAYARVFHPAEGPYEKRARWAVVAAWSGKVMHPHAEFERIHAGTSGEQSEYEPRQGELSADLVSALSDVLGRHTDSPDRCWFCVWDGWGWSRGAGAILTRVDAPADARQEAQRQWEAAWHPPFSAEAVAGPRLRLPVREYLLLEGPLDAVGEIGEWMHLQGESLFTPHSPDLWWPDDRAWFVASDVDLDSSYVAGSRSLIDQLLGHSQFEALEVQVSDQRGDSINPQT